MHTETFEGTLPGATSAVAQPPALPKRSSAIGIAQTLLRGYNALRRVLAPVRLADTSFEELREVRARALQPCDINEHLETMFLEALILRPELIVELGVRGGTSTFVFERAARLVNSSVVSVDVEDCSAASEYAQWHFVQGDDVQFAHVFPDFCRGRNISPKVDLLFIDTSHYYEHTVQEIRAWFPLLSPRAKVIFHDTNSRYIGARRDGCFELAWDNDRGVVRAIEEHLGIQIDEKRQSELWAQGWLVRHSPYCNGLTILDRLSS